jgi:hypothetical protein
MKDKKDRHRLSYKESLDYVKHLTEEKISDIDYRKGIIHIQKDDEIIKFKPPLCFPDINIIRESLYKYQNQISQTPKPYLIILMRAGNASLGYFEDGKNIYHKVIRKYMVRKKQGKAQITHLHKKGKSKLGSRIRLAQTKKYFQEINDKIIQWDMIEEVSFIFYYSPVRLWSMLFKQKGQPAFDKRDSRLVKLPLDIRTPNIKELKRSNYYIKSGFIEIG